MTRVDISPEQFDAEAARPRPVARRYQVAEARQPRRVVEESIELHRALYRDDLNIKKLTTESPPVLTNSQTGERKSDPMSMLGPTLSLPLTRFITEEYGYLFPWNRGLQIMRYRFCRREHPEHWERPEWMGSLCYQLVSYTVRFEYSLPRACFELGTSPDRSGRVLSNALYWIEDCMDAQRQRQEEKRLPDKRLRRWDEPIHHEKHDFEGMHQEDCAQCLRLTANGVQSA